MKMDAQAVKRLLSLKPECPKCLTHGAWALSHNQVHKWCRCGHLGAEPAAGPMLFKFLVESVEPK